MSPKSPSGKTTPRLTPEITGAVNHWVRPEVGEARGSPSASTSSGSAAAAINNISPQHRTEPSIVNGMAVFGFRNINLDSE